MLRNNWTRNTQISALGNRHQLPFWHGIRWRIEESAKSSVRLELLPFVKPCSLLFLICSGGIATFFVGFDDQFTHPVLLVLKHLCAVQLCDNSSNIYCSKCCQSYPHEWSLQEKHGWLLRSFLSNKNRLVSTQELLHTMWTFLANNRTERFW
jgi:hypothetical protein